MASHQRVIVAGQSKPRSGPPLFIPRDRGRMIGGLVLAVVAPIAATPVATAAELRPFPAVWYFFAVVAVSLVGLLLAGLVAAGVSAILLDYYVLSPTHSLALTSGRELIGITAFIVAAAVTSYFLSRVDVARTDAESARKRLSFLGRASDVLATSLETETTLTQLAHLVVPELADWCAVDFLQPDGSIANLAFSHAAEGRRRRSAHPIPRPRHPHVRRGVRPVIQSGRSELYPEIPEGLLVEPSPDGSRELGLSSIIVAPLSARGRTFGALTLVVSRSRRRYSRDDLLLAEEVAERAALAIDNARLHGSEATARRSAEVAAERMGILQQVTALLSGSLTPEDIAEVLVSDGIGAMGAVGGLVAIVTQDRRSIEVMRSFGYERTLLERWSSSLDAPLPLPEALRTATPVVVHSQQERDERYPMLAGTPPDADHTLVCLPMAAGGRPLGGIAVTFAESRSFTPEELDLMMALARQGAQALDRARLFAERDRVARTLQRGLLPPELSRIPGVEIAAGYHPAGGTTTEVGGDFYDTFRTGDGEWALMIGDVCGKGPEAAATTGFIRNTVRAIAAYERRPSAVLGTVSDLLRAAWGGVGFSTICYLRVRVSRSGIRLTLSSGGHPLPLLIHPDGRVDPVGRPGHILGVFEGPLLYDSPVDLVPGDILLLYTDGLIDPRAWGADAVEEKLQAYLQDMCGATPAEVVEGVTGLLPQTDLQDDVAMLAVRVT
jgi:serine phosphatase RsbU (regulator of sigma subunit)